MENIAHTLFGAALGQTGLKKLSHYGMPTLMISANLPDIDLLWSYYSDTSYIIHHRGFTHTFLGIFPQMFILSLFMYYFANNSKNNNQQVNFINLLFLSFIGLMSHIGLDYLNDYGIRPFSPFNENMYLAGNIFIVDAWFWLLLGGYVFLTINLSRTILIIFTIFALLSTLLITLFPMPDIPTFSRLLYLIVIIILGLIRFKSGKINNSKLGIFTFSTFFIYVATTLQLRNLANKQFLNNKNNIVKEYIKKYQISPSALNPFRWNFLIATEDYIYLGNISSIKSEWNIKDKIPTNFSSALSQKALKTKTGEIMQSFSPFIFTYLKIEDNKKFIYIRDARYIQAGEKSFASIKLDSSDFSTNSN